MAKLFSNLRARARGEHSDETATKSSIDQLHNKLNVLDKILSTQDYFAGPRFTIVEAFYMPVVNALFYAGEGSAIEQCENLASWWGRVSNRESWKKINQNWIEGLEYLLDNKKKSKVVYAGHSLSI